MRALIATLLCAGVLVGSAVYVAQTVDTSAAEFRARAARALLAGEDEGCGCTADVRAKDRIEGRHTATQDSAD